MQICGCIDGLKVKTKFKNPSDSMIRIISEKIDDMKDTSWQIYNGILQCSLTSLHAILYQEQIAKQ